MKYLSSLGLLFAVLIFSGCSASFEGGYKGKLSVSGLVGGKSWENSESSVIALVKRDAGSSKVTFADTTLFRDCKDLTEGAACSVEVDGTTETLNVSSVTYQSREKTQGPGAVAIFIQGVTKQSKTPLNYEF